MQNNEETSTLSEIKVSYKANAIGYSLTSSKDAYQSFRRIWDSDLINIQEQFYVLFLNVESKIIGWRLLGTGGLSACPIDIRLLVALACKTLSTSVIIAHNHPSGNIKPSKADFRVTENINKALKLVGVDLNDHLILSDATYSSFLDEGYIS